MANEKHLEILNQGVEAWNQWREENPKLKPDLSRANLHNANLSYANLSEVNLRGANLNLANLRYAKLSKANLSNTNPFEANLSGADLKGANLSGTNLSYANLSETNLRGANLRSASLIYTDLRNADLFEADLFEADLRVVQALFANFSQSILTGTIIEDWQIGRSTNLEGVKCDYIFRKRDPKTYKPAARLPADPNSIFAPGEFVQRFQILESALETIDLTFIDGIDWKAFFVSFQELRHQYPAQNIAVQGMEEKDGAFVIRLKVEAKVSETELEKLKGAIETTQKQLYSTQLALSAAEGKIEVYREIMGVVQTLTERPVASKYTIHGDVGNLADVNLDKMTTNISKNYGAKADDILQLLNVLREAAQTFPQAQSEAVQVHLEDLANNLKQEKPQPSRLRTCLAALFGVAIAVGSTVATTTDFANNVLELSQKLSIPATEFQTQLQQLKQIQPDFEWQP
ncbi:MAG: pentapeptide repeat-containing protein [Leptolyngbya sp. SIO1D8]|nr:pentapeptide repeat-containing protein [Leptolyngbya sp. SIO1D8]